MSNFSEEQHWALVAAEVQERLFARVPENKIRQRIEPTRRAVELLGDPQRAYRVVHVTGTNGKTSTTRFIERILREHGLRTGRFSSPHLVHFNERIALDGEPISDERFVRVWQEIEPIIEIVDAELVASGEARLTFFEAFAVLAFAIFADAPIDVLVLEVGIGGEWDSTNVADGDVAVFTPISLDHTDRIGTTLAQIAATKSGIIKPGAFVVSAAQPKEALDVIEERANAIAERLEIHGKSWKLLDFEPIKLGQKLTIQGLAGEYRDLVMPVHGSFQAENMALAVAACEAFLGGGQQRILDDIVRVAVADASSPGRLQVVSNEPLVVLDAAHNEGGAKTVARALEDTFGAEVAIGVVSILAEKDALAILEILEPALEHLIATQSSSPRAIELEVLYDLAISVFGAHRVQKAANPWHAVQEAKAQLPKGDNNLVLVTGSVTLVGEILKQLQREEA